MHRKIPRKYAAAHLKGELVNKTGLEEYKGVYASSQQVDNELSGIAFELLGKAKDLAKDLDTDVTAVLIGSEVKILQMNLQLTVRTR